MIEVLPGGHIIIETLSVLVMVGALVVCFGLWQLKKR